MTTTTKVIIGTGAALFGAVILFLAVLLGAGFYYASDKEGAILYDEALKEGPKFGKTTDQEGCMREGFALLANVSDPTIHQHVADNVFVRECLEVSRSTDKFCDGVPSVPFTEWIEDECGKKGGEADICQTVYDAKHTFCNGL